MKRFQIKHHPITSKRTMRLELLESRQLMTANFLNNGTWDFAGTNAPDQNYIASDKTARDVLPVEFNGKVVFGQQLKTTRVPAEWERHDSTWMQWPKGEEVSTRENFVGIIRALQAHEQINLVVESSNAKTQASQYLQQRGVPLNNIQFQIMPYDWSWMRDNGAIWVEKTGTDGSKQLGVQDWGFDGWGGDGGPSRKDDAVPQHVAKIEGVHYEKIPVVLEKGTMEFNGKDTVITSWTVLHNRNPKMTRAQLESVLKDKFAVSRVVWIEGSAADDLTDGHVDGIARFVNEKTVVVSRFKDQSDPDAESSLDFNHCD